MCLKGYDLSWAYNDRLGWISDDIRDGVIYCGEMAGYHNLRHGGSKATTFSLFPHKTVGWGFFFL